MFERFTADARETVVAAQLQARELGHDRIGSEHLLLGLLTRDGDDATPRVLAALGLTVDGVREQVCKLPDPDALDGDALRTVGIDLDQVRRSVERSFGRGALDRRPRRRRGRRHIPFTDAAKQALEQSLREAVRLNHRLLGGEHILLGLLASPGTAAGLLARAGVERHDVEQRLFTVAS